MKIAFLFISCFFFGVQSIAQSKNMRVYIDTKQYYEASLQNFVEVNFQFVSTTLGYKGVDGGLKGEVAIYLDILKFDDTIVSDAYRMETPLMKDSILEDFYDVRRYQLAPGKYDIHLEIRDILKNNDPVKGSLPIIIEEMGKSVGFGSIQNVESAFAGNSSSIFYKSGFEIVPRLSNYYSHQISNLPYYTEIYNSNDLKSDQFGLKESIYNADTKTEIENYTKFTRLKTDKVVPVLRELDIAELPTGNYYLSLMILDSKLNEISEKKYYFERQNDVIFPDDISTIELNPEFLASIPVDSAHYYLGSLLPICGPENTRNFLDILKEKDESKSAKAIQTYWRKNSPNNSYESWIKYKIQVQYVEKLFSTPFFNGYDSDRGRIYLQYGAPTQVISREVSPTEFPWEIWQYNKIGKFSNKKFLFYNPDLIANNYRLLHSDLIGETKNLNFPAALKNRSAIIDANEQSEQTETMGGEAVEYFR